MKFEKSKYKRSQIHRECDQEGQSLEEQIRQAVANNQPIEARAPMIYTEEADGVQAQYDPRADRFDIALDAVDKYNKSIIAKAADNAPNNESGEGEKTE